MEKDYSISVIFPVYNEEGSIEKIMEESSNFLLDQDIFKEYEILAVDDGSRDNTARILNGLANRVPHLKIITHSENLGYGKTLMSGVKNSKYPPILFMDADGQFKIDSIDKMLNYVVSNDVIMGYRYRRRDSLYRVALGKIYTFLAFLLFGLRFKDINCGFKLFKREVIENSYKLNAGLFYTEALLRAKIKKFRIKEVAVVHFPRLKGKQSGASPKVIFKAVIDMIKLVILQDKFSRIIKGDDYYGDFQI